LSENTKKLEEIAGIGPLTVERLRASGYFTLESLAVASSREISEITGLSKEKAAEIASAARDMLEIKFNTADELLRRRAQMDRLTTTSRALDQLLGGGVESQAVHEFVGEYGTGKTQICHTLCASVQLPREKGGLSGGAIYIDTEGTFRPERLSQIAECNGMRSDETLKNVMVARAFNCDHQILIAEKLDEIIPKYNIKIVIVDSVISHFRAEYLGRENLTERQQRLNNHLHRLLRTAEVYSIPIVVTNQVVAIPDAFSGSIVKPAGGNVLAHLSTNRILLRKGKGNVRIARIIDSPYLPESECAFVINERGIEDVDDEAKKP
jgi:DNA repair protein RadA